MKQIINVNIIAGFMFKNKMNEKEFCNFCDVPYPLVSRIIFNDYNFNLNHILQIAEKINIEVKQLFEWYIFLILKCRKMVVFSFATHVFLCYT